MGTARTLKLRHMQREREREREREFSPNFSTLSPIFLIIPHLYKPACWLFLNKKSLQAGFFILYDPYELHFQIATNKNIPFSKTKRR